MRILGLFLAVVASAIVARPPLPPPIGGDTIAPLPGTACVAVNGGLNGQDLARDPDAYLQSAFSLFGWEPAVPPELWGKKFVACPRLAPSPLEGGPGGVTVGLWFYHGPPRLPGGYYAHEA